MSNFTKRAITALFFVLVLLGSIVYSQVTFACLFLFCTIVGMWEFYSIALLGENNPQKYYGLFLGIAVYVVCSLISMGKISNHYLLLFLPLGYFVFVIELYRKSSNPFRNIAYTMLGVVYVALPFALLSFIATSGFLSTYEPRILIGILLILWASDTGAYLVGSKLGKRKLFERISPKKSWEGSFGGAVLCLIAAYLDAKLFPVFSASQWFVIALIIVVMGTLGDLVESLYKRSKNIKDSGSILPGHGGILDRFDSLILASPFIYAYLELSKTF
ncbi:MAG: phosphatidate cytidylyltransferase [Bacteroidetes bacterium]|nr:phosphatidate cytidylyltransferase [Bacteroidota bacterium]